jgi:hypothetical protein
MQPSVQREFSDMRSNSFIEGTELSKEALWKGATSKTSREIEKIIIKLSLRDCESPCQDWIQWALLIYVL